METIIHQGKKIAVGIVGGLILLVGVITIFTPGPAIIIIPLGLGVLATQFEWAQRLLDKFRHKLRKKGVDVDSKGKVYKMEKEEEAA